MRIIKILGLAAGLLWIGSGGSNAGTLLEPGETVGIPTGAPLPQGFYFLDTLGYTPEARQLPTGHLAMNIPVFAWSTPWSFYDTRLELLAAFPSPYVSDAPIATKLYAYNPAAIAALAHDFGGGWGVTYYFGIRPGVPDAPSFHETSFEQRLAVSYTANGWNLTAILENGIFDQTYNPDYLMLDLTATKKFGNFEIGPVAFGSTDVGRLPFGYGQRESQFAVGGLLGYDFGPVTVQGIGATDVESQGYFHRDTRGFVRVIIPLGGGPQQPAPVVAKY